MTQRIGTTQIAFNAQPFASRGLSFYANAGASVVYRELRVTGGRRRGRNGAVKGTAGVHDIATGVPKTTRIDSVAHPTTSTTFALPAAWASQSIVFDVRHYRDDVENPSDNFRTVPVVLDSNRDEVAGIKGTAVELTHDVRAAGIVRVRFRYIASREGVQPTLFRLTNWSGPDSPADATETVSVIAGTTSTFEVESPTLLDSGPYTVDVVAENGATTLILLSGISIQADASGPPVLTGSPSVV